MAASKSARPARRSASGLLAVGVLASAAVAWTSRGAFVAGRQASAAPAQARAAVALRVASTIKNPVRTVSETVDDFYKAYPSPPVMPMYRTFLVDEIKSTHMAMVDSRFKYDAVFALGLREYYMGLMGTYDKFMGGSPESEKIWKAYCSALGLDAEKVNADADSAVGYAKETAPATILGDMEGKKGALGDAFGSIGSGLYSMSFSVGLFKMMQAAGVELSTANAEEWAKALEITPSKVSGDLKTYKLNQEKMLAAEEMLREIEIREKKKLAQRLEEKAKALAAKAAGKKEE